MPRPSPTAPPPAGSQVLELSCALQPPGLAFGSQPSLQPVGHLITRRRCKFPKAPFVWSSPQNSVSPPQFLEVSLKGLTASLPFPPIQLDRLREQKEFSGNGLGRRGQEHWQRHKFELPVSCARCPRRVLSCLQNSPLVTGEAKDIC